MITIHTRHNMQVCRILKKKPLKEGSNNYSQMCMPM